MLGQSGALTVLGMGVVFVFLIVMVFIVSVMGKVIRAMRTDKDGAVSQAHPSLQAEESVKNAAVVAAITAAVNEYRKVYP